MNQLLAVMHDRASINAAVVRIVKVVYPNMVDIGCISHTLDIVGDKFKTPNLNHFFTLRNSLFSHSFKARAVWKQQTGRAMSSGTTIRRWSRWEMMEQMMQQFEDIELYLRQADFSPSSCVKLLEILSNPQSRLLLRIELAAVVDVGIHFVKGTYNLEGDGILVFTCYQEILQIRNAISADYFPNSTAVC